MSHQEQHFAGIHYRGQFAPGMVFDNDYNHHATPIGYRLAPKATKPEYCPACNSAMLFCQHYPFEKQLRIIWQCKQCDRLFVFIPQEKK
jgi:hypothetical protein